MTGRFLVVAVLASGLASTPLAKGQSCCAPAVPPQGVLGETVALPQVLEWSLHFENISSGVMYEGTNRVDDPSNTKFVWERITLGSAYGLSRRFSISAVVPYLRKEKSLHRTVSGIDQKIVWDAKGIGDITVSARYSLLPRSFVDYREISIGLGIKIPSGFTERECYKFRLPAELQPGTGSWDYLVTLAFYQGFELVDLLVSGSYVLTTPHHGIEFGNQASYLVAANFHITSRVDLVAALSGSVAARNRVNEVTDQESGRHQMWVAPGVQVQIVPIWLRLHGVFEKPIYQHFNGVQLGSDYSLRISAIGSIPLRRSNTD